MAGILHGWLVSVSIVFFIATSLGPPTADAGLDFRGQRLSSGLIAPGFPDAVMLQLFIAMQH
jgi:hypothetical protein